MEKPAVHVHSWTENIAGSISYTTDSVIIYSCTYGEGKQETIPALGHDMKNGNTIDPTCTEYGRQTMRCSRCRRGRLYGLLKEVPEETTTTDQPETDSATEPDITPEVIPATEPDSTPDGSREPIAETTPAEGERQEQTPGTPDDTAEFPWWGYLEPLPVK